MAKSLKKSKSKIIKKKLTPGRAKALVWKGKLKKTPSGLTKKDLTIREVFVSPGPVLKRFRPRAQGRAFAIRKPTCHITAVVGVK